MNYLHEVVQDFIRTSTWSIFGRRQHPAAELAAAVTGALASPDAVRCRRCAAPLPPWVRQSFLRHGMRRWPARVVEPVP